MKVGGRDSGFGVEIPVRTIFNRKGYFLDRVASLTSSMQDAIEIFPRSFRSWWLACHWEGEDENSPAYSNQSPHDPALTSIVLFHHVTLLKEKLGSQPQTCSPHLTFSLSTTTIITHKHQQCLPQTSLAR